MRVLLTVIVGVSLIATLCKAGEMADLGSEKAKVNYSIGYQIGDDFRRQGVQINSEAMLRGIQDALSENTPLMTPEEQRTALINLQRQVAVPTEQDDADKVQE